MNIDQSLKQPFQVAWFERALQKGNFRPPRISFAFNNFHFQRVQLFFFFFKQTMILLLKVFLTTAFQEKRQKLKNRRRKLFLYFIFGCDCCLPIILLLLFCLPRVFMKKVRWLQRHKKSTETGIDCSWMPISFFSSKKCSKRKKNHSFETNSWKTNSYDTDEKIENTKTSLWS